MQLLLVGLTIVLIGDALAQRVVERDAEPHRSSAESEVSVAGLRAKKITAALTFERHLYTKEKIKGDLYSYLSDGLKLYSLVITPNKTSPDDGFPILIFGHGFHPQPKKYGITNNGVTRRPGDYYRGIPERYAQEGYLVIAPDYRGHNISEGFEYTQRDSLSSSYYASDVLHLISALEDLPSANSSQLVYVGHSMGGDVGLKVMLATNRIKAASLWSPAIGSTPQQALYYGRYYDENINAAVDSQKLAEYSNRINAVYAKLPVAISVKDVDPINHLKHLTTPLIIQHARSDRSAPYQWSEDLVIQMNSLGKEFLFYSYDSKHHLFKGDNLEQAFQRDLTFFDLH